MHWQRVYKYKTENALTITIILKMHWFVLYLMTGLDTHMQSFVSVSDFEIVLDAAGEPVTSAAVKLLNPDELGYQR